MAMSAIRETRAGDEVVKDGICYMCTSCCPIKIHVRDGKAVRIDMLDEKVADICPRWKAQLDFVYHPDRLLYPLKRKGERGNSTFERISWDEALDTVAGNLQKVKEKYGAESVVFFIAYTKEPRPYFHRLVHAFGSPNYCTESSNCSSAAWLASLLNYGKSYAYLTGQSKPVDPASKCLVVWGSSIVNSAPSLWEDYVAARKKGVKLIVVDPYRTSIASMADIHLQLRPGTDGALALGMINVIIGENLYDKGFVEEWTVGFSELKKLAQQYTPGKVEKITWVPAQKIREAALLYATTKPAKLAGSASSTTHHANGVQSHRAIVLLPALTGNLDVSGGNCFPLQSLPVNDITLHNELIEKLPPGLGSDRFPIWTKAYREMSSNLIAERIYSGKPYPLKALFGCGLNITYFPDSQRFVESLKKLDFIAITEYFHTAATAYADIVLPVSSWLERQMLFTVPGGFVQFIDPAIEPVGETWPEWKIYSELAKRLGIGGEFWDGDFEKCANHILQPLGLTVEKLRQQPEGVTCSIQAKAQKYSEDGGFQTPSGKVEIVSSLLAKHGQEPLPVYKEPAESPVSRPDLAKSFPLVMTTGARKLAYTNSQFRNIPRLRKMEPEPVVEINPQDAKVRGIKTGDTVAVSSPRGSIKVKAQVTDKILAGAVMVFYRWPGEANVNSLISGSDLDPISGFAPLKSGLCQVKKV